MLKIWDFAFMLAFANMSLYDSFYLCRNANGWMDPFEKENNHSPGFHPSLDIAFEVAWAARSWPFFPFRSSLLFSSHSLCELSSLRFCSTPFKLFSQTTKERKKMKDIENNRRQLSPFAWRDVAEPSPSASCYRIIKIRATVQVHRNRRLEAFKFACGGEGGMGGFQMCWKW